MYWFNIFYIECECYFVRPAEFVFIFYIASKLVFSPADKIDGDIVIPNDEYEQELAQQRLDDELRLAEASVTSLVSDAAVERPEDLQLAAEPAGLDRGLTAGPLSNRGKCARCDPGCWGSRRQRKKCAHKRRSRKRNKHKGRRRGKWRKRARRRGGRRRKNRKQQKKWAFKQAQRWVLVCA